MRIEQGDLWDHWERGHKIVITTNVGWDTRTRENNMGAGMALQAARRWPWLPEWYGNYCRLCVMRWLSHPLKVAPVLEHDDLRLIFLPVKPLLDFADPERSWNQRARLDVIRVGLNRLRRHHGTIALALPGCGNGGLAPEDVRPLVQEYLPEERFTLCDWDHPAPSGRQARRGVPSGHGQAAHLRSRSGRARFRAGDPAAAGPAGSTVSAAE